MKRISMYRQMGFVTIVFILACAAFVVLKVDHSSAVRPDQRAANKQHVIAITRDGVGREVQFAAPNASAENITSSVNTVASFIYSRSGISLSASTKTKLAQMETRALNGTRRSITVGELSEVMTAMALERLSSLTDQQIEYMASSLSGFDVPDLPNSFRNNGIRVRASRSVGTTQAEFADQVKAIRGQLGTTTGKAFQSMAHDAILAEVQGRVKILSEAVPEQFAGIWDVSNDRPGSVGVTPLRAILVTYSVAGDDALYDSESNLRLRMRTTQEGIASVTGGNYPSPDGHFAYGANGYLYSTPLDLVFDEQTVNRLLALIEERSAA
jgi:hypothetical protein